MKNRKRPITAGSLLALTTLFCSAAPAFSQFFEPERSENYWFSKTEIQSMTGFQDAAAQSGSQIGTTGHPQGLRSAFIREREERVAAYMALALLESSEVPDPRRAQGFLESAASQANRDRVAFALGRYHFALQHYDSVIHYYEQADIAHLSNQEIAESRFELAYSYFLNQDFERSRQLFASIREIKGKYQSAGQYYFGLLAYHQGQFREALNSFEKIRHHEQYQRIVPYYIAEIHYFQGQRKKALEMALALLSSPEKSYYDTELQLLTAQILFEEQRYGDALPYFEQYYERVDRIRKEVLYEIGYAYYQVQEWENAIHKFRPLSHAKDSLGQAAMYLLGDSYLRKGELDGARNAFALSAQMPFNPAQQEASLLLSAKLSYSLGEMDQAMSHIRQLIARFPASAYRSEALALLSDLLARTNNYEEAYTSLQGVMDPQDPLYLQVFPKVSFGYAMMLLEQGKETQAGEVLQKAIRHPELPSALGAAIRFWLAEIAYHRGDFSTATQWGTEFLRQAEGKESAIRKWSPAATPDHARLTLGYAAMEKGQFDEAEAYFRGSREAAAPADEWAPLSLIREADAAFMQKNYAGAMRLYRQAAERPSPDQDYAQYQIGLLHGLLDQPRERDQTLLGIIGRQPPSPYDHKARYALALAWMEENRYAAAIEQLRPLREGPMASQALIKTGYAYQQMGDAQRAIKAYEYLLAHFPQSEEKSTAREALKSLFISENRPQDYARLMESYPSQEGEAALSLDSTYYAAAVHQFAAHHYEQAKQAFTDYLESYPQGIFVIKAYYYKGESHDRLGEKEQALEAYARVLEFPWNEFTESSARHAGHLAMERKDYPSVLRYAEVLRQNAMGPEGLIEAYELIMGARFALEDYASLPALADTLLAMSPLSDRQRAQVRYYSARSLQETGQPEQALEEYRGLTQAPQGVLAAEAHYRIAEILQGQGKNREAEEAATETIKKAAGYEQWVVRSYLLLGRILMDQKDYFNASATLQSIIHHAQDAEIKKEAEALLQEVKEREAEAEKLSE